MLERASPPSLNVEVPFSPKKKKRGTQLSLGTRPLESLPIVCSKCHDRAWGERIRKFMVPRCRLSLPTQSHIRGLVGFNEGHPRDQPKRWPPWQSSGVARRHFPHTPVARRAPQTSSHATNRQKVLYVRVLCRPSLQKSTGVTRDVQIPSDALGAPTGELRVPSSLLTHCSRPTAPSSVLGRFPAHFWPTSCCLPADSLSTRCRLLGDTLCEHLHTQSTTGAVRLSQARRPCHSHFFLAPAASSQP